MDLRIAFLVLFTGLKLEVTKNSDANEHFRVTFITLISHFPRWKDNRADFVRAVWNTIKEDMHGLSIRAAI